MNGKMRVLGPAVGFIFALLPELTAAQSIVSDYDVTYDANGDPVIVAPLPPTAVIAEVRRAGFYPIGRPVLRGRQYILFAIDQDDMDVKLTVDGASGEVLLVSRVVARFGGPVYGYRSFLRADRPVPPGEIPAARSNVPPAAIRHAPARRPAPSPRTRPTLAGAAPKARQNDPQASTPVVPAAAPQPAAVAPPATPPPVTLVPVAPLD
jgi:hypothetical protein